MRVRLIALGLLVLLAGSVQGDVLEAADCGQCHGEVVHRDRTFGTEGARECLVCHNGRKQGHDKAAGTSTGHKKEMPLPAVAGRPHETAHPKVGADPNPMVLVPAGEFIMGTDDRLPDEGPQHVVYLDSFYIDRYEVTNAQYKQFIDATGRRSPPHFRNRTYPPGKADHPVTYVSWYDADAYCRWAGKRLPTDAEWEKAARGVDGRIFPWGNEFDVNKANTPQRWARLQQEGDTLPVGSLPEGASPYGVYDMSGNVWEWTASWYQPYPGNTHPNENYGEKYKTLKGGSWFDCSFYKCGISAPVFNRAFFLRSTRNKSFGFRCARDAGPEPGRHADTMRKTLSGDRHETTG